MVLPGSVVTPNGRGGKRLENGNFLLMDWSLTISEMGFVPLDLSEFLALYCHDHRMATVASSFLNSVLFSFPSDI